MREKVQLTNDNRHIQQFKATYDKLFYEFHQAMFEEYKNLKETYIAEYQDNYQMNLNEKQANIDGFLETIEEKKKQVGELERFKAQNQSCIQRFFEMKTRLRYYKTYLKGWQAWFKRRKEKKRVAAYTRNHIYRMKMKSCFRQLRAICHEEGRKKIKEWQADFQNKLETEKLTMWSSKVDQLMLYMA